MNKEKATQQEIISLAKNTKHYCELLIAQSESWVEKEKGRREKRRKEKEKGND
jgi:hypothetical protein